MVVNPATGEILNVFLRTAYNYDMNEASDETALRDFDLSRTQQQFKDEVDINTIVERFGLTGELPENLAVPQSGDFTDVKDFQTAMNVVLASQAAFMEMPATVRKRFENDPQQFLDFVYDPANRDEARSLGLLMPEVVQAAPMKVEVVNSVAPAPQVPSVT